MYYNNVLVIKNRKTFFLLRELMVRVCDRGIDFFFQSHNKRNHNNSNNRKSL